MELVRRRVVVRQCFKIKCAAVAVIIALNTACGGGGSQVGEVGEPETGQAIDQTDNLSRIDSQNPELREGVFF